MDDVDRARPVLDRRESAVRPEQTCEPRGEPSGGGANLRRQDVPEASSVAPRDRVRTDVEVAPIAEMLQQLGRDAADPRLHTKGRGRVDRDP
jgi:hypothetical protein